MWVSTVLLQEENRGGFVLGGPGARARGWLEEGGVRGEAPATSLMIMAPCHGAFLQPGSVPTALPTSSHRKHTLGHRHPFYR